MCEREWIEVGRGLWHPPAPESLRAGAHRSGALPSAVRASLQGCDWGSISRLRLTLKRLVAPSRHRRYVKVSNRGMRSRKALSPNGFQVNTSGGTMPVHDCPNRMASGIRGRSATSRTATAVDAALLPLASIHARVRFDG
jgi:hypothetical protein